MEIYRDSAIPPVSPKHPWFVVAQNPEDDTQVHIFYNIRDRMSHYCCQIPELLGMRIRGCFHGCWAVLSSNHPRDVIWSLWNPITSNIINLPPLNHSGSEEEGDCDDMRDCCLSAPPEDPNSVLLLMRTAKPSFVYFIVEVNIVVDDCESKKLGGEVVITLLPVLEFFCIHVSSNPPLLKGSCTELFIIYINLKDRGKTVAAVNLFKLDVNNMTWEELGDLKDTILSVELATNSSVFYSSSSELAGGYIHILADKGKSIYSYHVKDKTIFLSSIPCVAGTNPGLGGERVHVHCKQEKEGHKEDQIVIRSVKGNREIESHRVLKKKEFCVGVECLKLLPLPYECSRLESDADDESRLLNLPPHVLEMLIMEFCAGVDYLNFRSTSKGCHLAAPLMAWNNGKASKIMQKYSLPSPWLIVFNKHKGIVTLTDPMFGNEYFMKTPQELICKFYIKCSRFGWLLILKPDGSLMFFNPFTSDIIKLPQLIYTDIISFSAPPTSPDCMVVGITVHMQCHFCIFIVGGEPSWRRLLLPTKGGDTFHSVTFYGRDVYALRDNGRLDVFKEMGRGDYKLVRDVAQAPASCCTSFQQYFHLECDEHSLRVIVGKFGESVEVFKLTVTKKWVKIGSLGKHMIFICDGVSSFCLDAKTPQMENKIYFPSFPIMYYSLETCRFHTSNIGDIKDSFGDLCGTKHHLTPHGWIEPRWS
ncbi:hypothetical protein Tco_0796356 [Tanacetum coccineum]